MSNWVETIYINPKCYDFHLETQACAEDYKKQKLTNQPAFSVISIFCENSCLIKQGESLLKIILEVHLPTHTPLHTQ